MRNTLITILITCLVTLLLATVFTPDPAAWAAAYARMDEAWQLAMLCGRGLVALMLLAGAVWLVTYALRQQWKMDRPQDGSFALREYWLEPLPRRVFNWIVGRPSVRVLVNPNNEVGAVRVLGPFGTAEIEPQAGWAAALEHRRSVQTTHNLQALNPGDDVIGSLFGHRWRNRPAAPTAKMLTSKPESQPRQDQRQVEPESQPLPELKPVKLSEGLMLSQPSEWVLGLNTSGKAVFNPDLHHNLGIVGGQGTGKTACTGFHVLALALRFGMHPIILDPKGGIDFRRWESHAEWHATDADVFGDQVAQLLFEHKRRQSILEDFQAPNIDALPPGIARGHVLVMVEEFGALWEDMQASMKPAAVTEVSRNLDTLMRLSRATGIHWCVIDQFPDKWSKQVFAAMKCRLVYKVAPGQDNFMREYGADKIADRGQFMWRGDVYNAWHVTNAVPRLLAQLPASTQPAVIGSVSSAGAGDTPLPEVEAAELPAEPASEPNTEPAERAADKRDLLFRWRDENPGGTQTEFRAWAFRQGVHVAKGYTSDTWKLYDAERKQGAIDLSTDAGRAAFAALAADARLPGGDKLGIDVSVGAI